MQFDLHNFSFMFFISGKVMLLNAFFETMLNMQ